MIAYRPYRRFVGQVRHTLVGGPPGDEDHNIWNWYISTALIGVIDGGFFDLLLHACPPGKETRFASVATFGANLTIFVGPLLGVALANATSVRVALIAAGLLQLAAGAAFVLLPRDV